jgi:hypothetical protein
MLYIAMKLCRVFGRISPIHFPVKWVSIMHEVVEGFTFDWDKILSDNLTKEIAEYQMAKSKGQPAYFYMSAYVMDTICYMTPFLLMNWSWNPTCAEPIHFYHSKLWEEKVKEFFYEVCHYVVILIHQALYGYPPLKFQSKLGKTLKPLQIGLLKRISLILEFWMLNSPSCSPKVST